MPESVYFSCCLASNLPGFLSIYVRNILASRQRVSHQLVKVLNINNRTVSHTFSTSSRYNGIFFVEIWPAKYVVGVEEMWAEFEGNAEMMRDTSDNFAQGHWDLDEEYNQVTFLVGGYEKDYSTLSC